MWRIRIGSFAAVALLALTAASGALGSRESESINDVASWLAQRAVGVTCLTPQESLDDPVISIYGAEAYVQGWRDWNYAWHPLDKATFKFGYCEAIEALASRQATLFSVEELAEAVLILTHESGHLRGHRWSADEAKTECWAIRHFKYVAARLGVEPGSSEMALLYGYGLALHTSLPAQYQNPPGGCVVPVA